MKINVVLRVGCIILVFLAIGLAEKVQAEIISFPASISIPLTQTDWVDQPLAFPKFNSTFGTLTKVQIDFKGNIATGFEIFNQHEVGIVVDGHTNIQFTIQNVENTLSATSFEIDAGSFHADVPALTTYQQTVLIIPGIAEGDAWAGPIDGLQYIDSSTLNEFSGMGDIILLASAYSRLVIDSVIPVAFSQLEITSSTQASLVGSVTYHYNAVPEPALIMLLTSFGVAIVILFSTCKL